MSVHVVGAGLAGLACALALADAGREVVLHETAGQAGGRCRSWADPRFDRVLDNGTHMVVGGNNAVFSFLKRIGAGDGLTAGPTAFPMLDMANGQSWTARPANLWPSILKSLTRLALAPKGTIADHLGGSDVYRRFWEPLALAIMNTPPDAASAEVFRRVLARTLWRGAAASRPHLAHHGLSETFAHPAIRTLEKAGAVIRFHHPLRGLGFDGNRVGELGFDDETVMLARHDAVVLAVPWAVAAGLLPGMPDLPSSPIVNAHFQMVEPPQGLTNRFLGLIGAAGQWLFLNGDVLSITVSAAAEMITWPAALIADRLWDDAAKALGLSGAPSAVRVIKEKRATLFHSPAVERLRPTPRVGDNLLLAGDWTATGLPCTLEGALRSGNRAARLVLAHART